MRLSEVVYLDKEVEKLKKLLKSAPWRDKRAIKVCIAILERIPSFPFDPEELRPKGEWGEVRYLPMYDTYVSPCSNCGYESTEYHKPYCPNCGAKMDEANDRWHD